MRFSTLRLVLLIGVSVVLMLAGQILLPGFVSANQIANQLKIASFLGVFALCQTVVIAAGGQGLDLSVGAIATLGGVVGAAVMAGSNTLMPVGCAVAIAAGAGVGLINGLGIAVLRIPPLVATLAMASVVDGALIVFISVAQPSNAASPLLVLIAGRASAGIPNVVIVWGALTLAAVWILARTAWGRRLRATGANARVALLSGTNTIVMQAGAYVISGAIAALAGFLLTGYVGQAFLGLGNAYILTSIVVAVIGGVALAGGQAPYLSVVAAAIMMTVLVSLLTAVNMPESGRQIIFGLTLLAFLVMDRQMGKPRGHRAPQ
jgi:ribose transport system permease protein